MCIRDRYICVPFHFQNQHSVVVWDLESWNSPTCVWKNYRVLWWWMLVWSWSVAEFALISSRVVVSRDIPWPFLCIPGFGGVGEPVSVQFCRGDGCCSHHLLTSFSDWAGTLQQCFICIQLLENTVKPIPFALKHQHHTHTCLLYTSRCV